jgi:Tfp pilus assembly protein PilN
LATPIAVPNPEVEGPIRQERPRFHPRHLLAFGSGVGIEVGASNLEIAVTRVRLARVHVLGRLTLANFVERPAAEWGAEYTKFLKSLGVAHLSATVLLPRREVIVRNVALPGVAAKDLEGAIRFQLDSLHPYGEDDVAWGWSRLAFGAVLVGIVRRLAVDQYYQLLTEAGIAVSSFTFSAAAVHAAIRLNKSGPAAGFVALGPAADGGVEVYGESPAKPVFSAEFNMPPQRAAVLALSELRLPPETAPATLEEVLPTPDVNPVENDLSRNARPYAAALAGACPRLAPAANVLPLEHRRSSSRAMFIPTVILASILVVAAVAVFVYSSYADRRYLRKLNAEIAKWEPQAQRASALDRQITLTRQRAQLLDQYRNRTRSDLDALNELTKLIEAPAWTNSVDLMRDGVRISGDASQAAPLLRILGSSHLFQNPTFENVGRSPSGGLGESFQIHAGRENRK